jgi:uncharacterized PurR-regulated membrane protein YhhQ (DUF165 family)
MTTLVAGPVRNVGIGVFMGWTKALYIGLFATANLLSLVTFSFLGVTWMLGSVAMIVAYGLLDLVHHVEGRSVAQRTILYAAVARAIAFLIVGWWRPDWALNGAIFFLAAEAAMIVSQWCVDLPIFAALASRGFVTRSVVSSCVSQPLSAAIFSVGAAWALAQPYWSVFVGALSLRVFLGPLIVAPVLAWLNTR